MTRPTAASGMPLEAEEERRLRYIVDHQWPHDRSVRTTMRRLLATLDRDRLETGGPYTDRAEHERQSSAGTHLFDEQCPFCFFDHFTPEARAASASWPPSFPAETGGLRERIEALRADIEAELALRSDDSDLFEQGCDAAYNYVLSRFPALDSDAPVVTPVTPEGGEL